MFRTLAYADIFDYPLTKDEIHTWLIKGDSFAPAKVSPYWRQSGGYYYLTGRRKIVVLREQRFRASQAKLTKLKKLVFIFKFLPFIKLVCVTGALAMKNCDADDDIDLMIVTAKNRLWLTRLVVSLLLLPHLRGGRMDSSKVADRICINLWLDETALAIKQQNLYIAHEICQTQPIFERDDFYNKFINANLWYKNYLPNWKP